MWDCKARSFAGVMIGKMGIIVIMQETESEKSKEQAFYQVSNFAILNCIFEIYSKAGYI